MTKKIRAARHRLEVVATVAHRRHHVNRRRVTWGVIVAAAAALAYHLLTKTHDGPLYHFAVAILADRLAGGLGGGGEVE